MTVRTSCQTFAVLALSAVSAAGADVTFRLRLVNSPTIAIALDTKRRQEPRSRSDRS
jgi:hypothetical protein